ncbi:MAG: hypothetical protein CVV00_02350 [Firmicutes bacterium HGW-Firmicutes-5]|nr:MAG: hypothetical protein CVV00_02350 [Firmicutes bacterium HGW-Firmicutes-5]
MKHNIVLQHIQDYGYNVIPTNLEDFLGYHCFNPLSLNTFILIFLDKELQTPNNPESIISLEYRSNLPFVYLILVDDNMEAVIDFAESSYGQDVPCLIYDSDDEVEFFLKDLWNTIVDLTKD